MNSEISRNFSGTEVPKDLYLGALYLSSLGTQEKFLILKNSAIQLNLRSRALWAFLQNAIAHQFSRRCSESVK